MINIVQSKCEFYWMEIPIHYVEGVMYNITNSETKFNWLKRIGECCSNQGETIIIYFAIASTGSIKEQCING